MPPQISGLSLWQHAPPRIQFHSASLRVECPQLLRIRLEESSAAQNGAVLQTCLQCGAVNDERAELCCFCDSRLSPSDSAEASSSSREIRPTQGNLAVNPAPDDWRDEVSSRLEKFRARRQGLRDPDSQPALPFSSTPPPAPPISAGAGSLISNALRAASRQQTQSQSQPLFERLEISITPSMLGQLDHAPSPSEAGKHQLYPVASLPERRRAAFLDLALLLFTFGAILALFRTLGGHLTLNRLDLAVTVVTFALFFAQYMTLFTVFGGSTPGMMLRGLRVVSFDGNEPSPQQLLWRSFGYLVSAGTLCLGFLWSLWDEDHLCWQDRISQTYLTLLENPVATTSTPAAPNNTQTAPR
jgi:uncharacterized RDD family membrane protein YckC